MEKYEVDISELKKIMVEQNLENIIDLSSASEVDKGTLVRVLNGYAKPSTTVIEKLVFALHIPPEKAGAIFFSVDLRNVQESKTF
ncbi:MAG: helix-turn-helix domain-containing protein [Butyrivibrio sp.]|nr:helix-turn-helix domain-containing protein [Butyrivibrio sp.]